MSCLVYPPLRVCRCTLSMSLNMLGEEPVGARMELLDAKFTMLGLFKGRRNACPARVGVRHGALVGAVYKYVLASLATSHVSKTGPGPAA